jgi:hypothetical protein
MLVRYHRLGLAAIVATAAFAVPAVALASGSGSPAGKPAPPHASATSASKTAPAGSQFRALAASAGISVNQLQAGLVAAKRAGGNTAAGIGDFAVSTGVSHATAQRVVSAVFKREVIESAAVPAVVNAFAARLGVSTTAAGRASKQIAGLSSQNDGAGPASPAVAAIARDLGVSPAKLAAAWDAVKQNVAGK